MRRGLLGLGGIVCVSVFGFLLADFYNPLPDPARVGSVVIEAEDHTPLRAFADADGVWRYPVTLEETSPFYLQALLGYEDRWFYYHPGVNPLALLRACWQWVTHGRVVSGGSTLTMQVARLLEPKRRTVASKAWQIFRALQLEWHYSKAEILTFYLNLAPYGGTIEGVQTASYAWLHKSIKTITPAEAALLTVLPQAPSRLRPDRYPKFAQQARDKVLRRLQAQGVWNAEQVADALAEPVTPAIFLQPFKAPLFALRMKHVAQQRGVSRLTTTLNANMQVSIENLLRKQLGKLPEKASIAVLVVENKTGFVRAYMGSVDFWNDERFGHVDMVRGLRSPGSTLKPFLYGMALDEGLIHSASLLSDVPLRAGGYAPQNFYRQFSGAVSAATALQQSLNIPAVDLLQRMSPATFVAKLRNGGITMVFPPQTAPNLSVILGGAGTRLEELVRGFTAFARDGVSIAPRFMADEPVVERHLLSAGAAWIVQTLLQAVPPPEGVSNAYKIAWKTGTSYGFRDAWSIGVSDTYTVGVWTGRPDGTPLPGRYGAYAAAPLLFDVFRALPKQRQQTLLRRQPANVTQAEICWPLGGLATDTAPAHCHVRQQAWLLDNQVPPTLPNLQHPDWSAGLQTLWVNPVTGLQVSPACNASERTPIIVARWPTALLAWLPATVLAKSTLPAWDASCPPSQTASVSDSVTIQGWDNSTKLYLKAVGTGGELTVRLQASAGVKPYHWFVNQVWVGEDAGTGLAYAFTQAGDYDISVVDQNGTADKVTLRVLSPVL